MEFHTWDNESLSGPSGYYDDGDQLTLWFDNMRLVDQDTGTIKWQGNAGVNKYYIYFDTLHHEGHPLPAISDPGTATWTGTVGDAEAGGYYHSISGASNAGMVAWAAPATEKILPTYTAPVAQNTLSIIAAKGESEVFQVVVKSDTTTNHTVNISDFTKVPHTIPSENVTLHRVDYVTITKLSDHFGRLGDWPDPLYPVTLGTNISFSAGTNQPLWFTVRVPRNAVPGVYEATVSVGSSTFPVELEVLPFKLPWRINLAGEWGLNWSNLVSEYKGTDPGVQPCYWDLVDAIYEDFAAHRLTPKGVGWPAGLNYPGGVEYDCAGGIDPEAWGVWGFHSTADKYLNGTALEYAEGFPSFQIKGPSSNWPPESRPSSFCSETRGNDPPGNPNYNLRWFEYWKAVSDYLKDTGDYSQKGYYHIVNEPQTGIDGGTGDHDITAYLAAATKTAAPDVKILVSEQVEPGIYDNPTYPGAKIDIWMPTISNYQVERAHDRQRNFGEDVWWYFLYGDRPPLPNPTVMDRPGVEARIIPWLAWLERVRGLVYYSIDDWSPNPWDNPWINEANGDGFMLYPPKEYTTIAFDACFDDSNRLVPSIRWELLGQGMEDYEYLWLLNQGNPEIGKTGTADNFAAQFISSRTRFSRVPTDLIDTRAAIANRLKSILFHVEPNGVCGNCLPCESDINSAINSATSGAIILVAEGHYSGNIELSGNKTLLLLGWDPGFDTLRNTGPVILGP